MVERAVRTRRRQVSRVRTLHVVPPPSLVDHPEVLSADPPTVSSAPASGAPRTVRTPRRPRWRQPTTILAALVVLALAGCVLAGKQWYSHHRLSAAHQAALAAARQTTVDFVTISAATVDRDLQRVVAGATGDFRDEFSRGLPQVRAAVIENKVESAGNVLRAALVSGDLDSAVVLVAVDASVKNTGAPDGRVSHYRIQVDVAVDGETDRWLVSRLQFVG